MRQAVQQVAHEIGAEVSFSFVAAVKSWVVPLLAGLGITMAVDQFLGGLLLSVAAAAIVRRRDPRQGRGIALYAAFTACVLAIIAAGLLTFYEIEFPLPLAMGLVGFFSRNIVNIASRFGDRVEQRSEDIADKAIEKVLPGEKK